MSPALHKLIGPVLAAMGVVATVVAIVLGVPLASFLSRAEATTGTVVESKKNPASNMTRSGEIPVVEFSDRDGRTHRFEGYSSFPPRYNVGNAVELYYLPSEPDEARIDDFIDLWLWPTLAGGLALVFLPLGIGLWFAARRRA